MSGKRVVQKPTMGQQMEALKRLVVKTVARLDGQETSIQGLIERIKQEFKTSVESLKTLIIRSELTSASGEMMSRSIRNCQTEVDSIFYLLNRYEPEVFSMEALREMTMLVHRAKTLGPAIDAICGFHAKVMAPTATLRFGNTKEEQIESRDGTNP